MESTINKMTIGLDPDEISLAERLRAHREGLGWTLQKVEELSAKWAVGLLLPSDGLSEALRSMKLHTFKASVLGAYERGERVMSVPRLKALARFYQVSIDHLLGLSIDTSASPAVDAVEVAMIGLVSLSALMPKMTGYARELRHWLDGPRDPLALERLVRDLIYEVPPRLSQVLADVLALTPEELLHS
jgi:transcriptional regulator with XRE-family HTH domain